MSDPLRELYQVIRNGVKWGDSPYFFPNKNLPLHVRLIHCGFETVDDPAYSYQGLNRGKAEFCIFQYTVAGEGVLDYEGRKYTLSPGKAFLVHVPHDHRYYLDGGSWTHFFCSFSGKEAFRIQRNIEAQCGPVLEFAENSEAIWSLLRIIQTVRAKTDGIDEFKLSGMFYSFLMSLSREAFSAQQSFHDERNPDFMKTVLQYCLEHLADPDIGVDEMAQAAGYSKYHFSRLFRENQGVSPGQFLRDLRLRSALRMLQFEFYNIKEISARCGFTDESYFCRIFKEKFGQSPGQFRKPGD